MIIQPHILHVEDTQSVADFCRAVCRAAGWRFTWLPYPPPQLIDRVAVLQPDVIVLDINMPQMNGLKAARILKTDGKTQHIPIIFLTTMTGGWYHREAERLGAAAYLVKGETTATALRDAMRACLP